MGCNHSLCSQYREYILGGGVILEYKERNTKIIKLLGDVYSKFAECGIEKIFVSENLGVLLASGLDIHLFTSGDVDNCAHPSEEEKIRRVMREMGFLIKEVFAGKRLVTMKCYPPSPNDLPEKFYIGIDFQISARTDLPCYVEQDQFLSWNLRTYKDTMIKLPTNEEISYICMLHTSVHRFVQSPGIRLYFDLMCAHELDCDIQKIEKWTIDNKTRNRVSISMLMANELVQINWEPFVVSRKNKHIVHILYDKKNSILKPIRNKIGLLLVEALCFDTNVFCGLLKILFPRKDWLLKTYHKNIILSELLHLAHLA